MKDIFLCPGGLPEKHMLRSEILASFNFNKNSNIVPWIGEQPYNEILFVQFPNIPMYIRVVGKCWISILMYNFSPIQGTMSKKMENYRQISPLLSTRIRTLSSELEAYAVIFNNNSL